MKRFILPLFVLVSGCSGQLLPVAPQAADDGSIPFAAAPVPAPSSCANRFLPSPSPAPAGSFTYEIETPDTPPAVENMKTAGQTGPGMDYVRGELFLNLVSESYARPLFAKYDLAQKQQQTILPLPDATGAAAATLACPSFLVEVNHPNRVDLGDLGTLAEHFGLQGHFVFNDHDAAALFKLGFQIMEENPLIVTVCGPDTLSEPF